MPVAPGKASPASQAAILLAVKNLMTHRKIYLVFTFCYDWLDPIAWNNYQLLILLMKLRAIYCCLNDDVLEGKEIEPTM